MGLRTLKDLAQKTINEHENVRHAAQALIDIDSAKSAGEVAAFLYDGVASDWSGEEPVRQLWLLLSDSGVKTTNEQAVEKLAAIRTLHP